ncbi:large conductance mechanosensitive channel protein MscL [Mariniblastus fucicola]|uniref:Large-conductance mechanosensitive channel n=1 Tax=Mariniblastus fucicola TaxID=980251 RepID=A0A5B9PR65_9BACT|nr:large conductance mechanosensitive channel protein MscL [Mariniblastus fucicola]QEG24991.1 Large-conductance mechanosensitive channel [Mariniblastus fucicola]
MSFISDFKEFAFKGNLIDMAVGLVMGTAVAAMVKSFIDHIIMPLVASIVKVGDMSGWTIPIGTEIEKEVDGVTKMVQAEIGVGSFIQEVINFSILAFVIFIALKVASRWMKKAEEETPPSDEVVLLTEIRDSLAKR